MKESAFQSKLLARLRKHPALKDAVVWKINDRFTRGIPDVLVSLRGVTTFFELKCWPRKATKIQVYYLNRLQPRAFLVTKLRGDNYDFRGILLRSFDELVSEIVRRCVNV